MSLEERRHKALAAFMARVLNIHAEDDVVPRGGLLQPHHEGRRYSMFHYNVVIPDLPEPHRFLACAVLAGRTGTLVFDDDPVVAGTPRNTATLALGTAATAPDGFHVYDMRADCDLAPDGSHLQFGQELTITGTFPDFHVVVHQGDLTLDLRATCTDQITSFIRSAVYDHVGYPARYEGELTWQGETRPVSGVLSLEYARAASLAGFRDRVVPPRLKLPWNLFTYHVIKISPDTLLMLASCEAWGEHLSTTAYLKQVDGASERHPRNVEFDVLSYRDEEQVAPDGRRMKVPERFRWRILDEDGAPSTEIVGSVDTELIYGLGRGWIGGYSYEGHHEGEAVSGDAYFEYVDVPTSAGA